MRALLVIAMALLSLTASGQSEQKKNEPAKVNSKASQNAKDKAANPPLIQEIATPQGESKPGGKQETPRLEEKPWLTHGEWVMAILTLIYVLFTGIYVVISILSFKAIKRQADLTEKQGESNAAQFKEEISAMTEARKQTDDLIRQATAQAVALTIAANAATEQAKAAETAADAATDAAEAAMLNAEAVMNAERAWFMLKKVLHPYLVGGEKGYSIIHLKNFGKTPAKVVSQKFELQISNKNAAPPNWEAVRTNIPHVPDIIPQDMICPWTADLPGVVTFEQINEILTTKSKFLWLCGIITYLDVFETEGSPQAIHETRICYLYQTLLQGNPFWTPAGPDEYNIAT